MLVPTEKVQTLRMIRTLSINLNIFYRVETSNTELSKEQLKQNINKKFTDKYNYLNIV